MKIVPTLTSTLIVVCPAHPPDQIRDSFMPVNKRWPLAQLMACLHRHFPLPSASASSSPPRAARRRKGPVALEYVMLECVRVCDVRVWVGRSKSSIVFSQAQSIHLLMITCPSVSFTLLTSLP